MFLFNKQEMHSSGFCGAMACTFVMFLVNTFRTLLKDSIAESCHVGSTSYVYIVDIILNPGPTLVLPCLNCTRKLGSHPGLALRLDLGISVVRCGI